MTVRPLPDNLKEKAKKEINENPRSVDSDLSALKIWLHKQPHLHTVNPSDQWLVAFLRGSKFSLERCKDKLDMYYTLRSVVPEFFSNRDPLDSKIQEILKLGRSCFLLRMNKERSFIGTRLMDLTMLSVTFYTRYRFPWDTTFCIITLANLLSNFELMNKIIPHIVGEVQRHAVRH